MSGFPGQPDDLRWDPFDESLKDDPHPVWKRLRDEAPAYPATSSRTTFGP